MEDYIFSTENELATNACTMNEFLNNGVHFYSRFDEDADVLIEDGSYAEVKNGDGNTYAVHAGGNGDFTNHIIRFELL